MALTRKQRAFVEHYLTGWNATQAARQAGYAHPNVLGPRLLTQPNVAAEIEGRIAALAMTADEALALLASIARGSFEDFLEVGPGRAPALDLVKAQQRNQLHLIQKVRCRRMSKTKAPAAGEQEEKGNKIIEEVIEIELYSAFEALSLLLRVLQRGVGLTDPTPIQQIQYLGQEEGVPVLHVIQASFA